MPYIEESKYRLLQEDLDNTKLQLEETEQELNEAVEKQMHQKQKSRTFIILLSIFLGIAIGIIFLFKSGVFSSKKQLENTDEKIDIAKIKADEARRVIDSIQSADNSFSNDGNTINVEDELAKVEENNNGKTIYSVQIGVFTKNRFALLSENTLATITPQNSKYFKYSLGIFSTLKEAQKLKEELVKIGFNDVFVASYINGERQQMYE